MNKTRGRGSGLALIVILVVAVIVAVLVVAQMRGFGLGKQGTQQEQAQQNAVDQARDLVNQVNERTQNAGAEP